MTGNHHTDIMTDLKILPDCLANNLAMNILIIGKYGFIGSHLADPYTKENEGHQVYKTSRFFEISESNFSF